MLHNPKNIEIAYHRLLSLPQWEVKRKEIILRDREMCRSCGDRNCLQVHHRQYHIITSTSKFKDPWDYNQLQLITLCKKCHEAGHKIYKIPVFFLNN